VIVLDASVLAGAVGDDGADGRAARRRLLAEGDVAIPDLADVETVAVLRKRWRSGDLSDRRFKAAVRELLELPIARYPTGPLMTRAYELRANVTAYDACYVALAEGLGCTLLTADARLSRAPGIWCGIEVFVTAAAGR
jgi:predicted nucleic acid-binding protein